MAKTKTRSRKTASAARPKPAARRTSARPPLAGVRVIDLTRVLAGPFCAMSLGDMGAEVIKIEEPGKGDDTRGWPPFVSGEATYFLSVNRNKKSLTLNMKAPEGQEILRKLLASADVVLENFRPGTMERLGFGYAALRKANPKLVYCSISGFGESGPEAHRPGYDLIVQGESGVMDITGFPDGPPVKVGNSIGDLVAGMAAAQGITLALLSREKTGRGQKVEIGMLDVMASLLTYQAGLYLNAGGAPRPARQRAPVHRAVRGLQGAGRLHHAGRRQQLAVGPHVPGARPRGSHQGSALRHRGQPRDEPEGPGAAAQRDPGRAARGRVARAAGQGGRARGAHQVGGRGVRERAPQGAGHDGVAGASEGGADHGDGRAGAPARHAGRGDAASARCSASTPTRS